MLEYDGLMPITSPHYVKSNKDTHYYLIKTEKTSLINLF